MHAHRCENCFKTGKQTVWIHGEECVGKVAAHTCPECGAVEWKKWLIPVSEKAKPKAAVREMPHPRGDEVLTLDLEQIIDSLSIMLLAVALILMLAIIKNYAEKKQ